MYSNSVIRAISLAPLCLAMTVEAQAATLGERAIYTVNVLPENHADQVGQCSAFVFGDISNGGCLGGFFDNQVLTAPTLVNGNGISGDGLAGTMTIETAVADGSGNNTFAITAFQMDPYLATAGGVFKTSMDPANAGAAMTGTGTVNATGGMTLDPTGRVGVAQYFEGTLGIQPWNIDNSTKLPTNGDPITNAWQVFTTGSSTNYDPTAGGANLTLTGRAIGDANADTILDALLVAAGNVGAAWSLFDGTPYSEALNVQFVLVSAKPVAKADTLGTLATAPLSINVANDLLVNDQHADATETILFVSFTPPTSSNGTLVDQGGGVLLYTPPSPIGELSDTFTYTIEDGTGAASSHTATVTINLAQNAAPTANDDSVTTDEDVAKTIDPTANDTDPDPLDVLTVAAFDANSAQGGTIIAGAGNNLVYSPPANYFGSDNFGYTISDGNGNNASAVVYVTVSSINDPLVCTDVGLVTDTDVALDIDVAAILLSTCSDIDVADTPAFSTIQTPSDQGGNISFDGVNTLTYTPALGFSGKDTFTYTATDGAADDVRMVTITVGITYDNFTMLNTGGNTFGGTNDVLINWDGTFNTDELDYANNLKFNVTIASEGPEKFNGFVWTAHTARVFGPGTYSFDTGCTVAEIQSSGCSAGSAAASGPALTMTVDVGQIGVHMLFDWSTSTNIDVVNVYDTGTAWDNLGATAPKNELWLGLAGASPDPATSWEWVSTDDDGDGIVGVPMIDGPFIGYSANFNKGPGSSGTSVQAPFTGTATDTKLGGTLSLTVLFVNLFALIGFRYFSRKRGRV